VELYALVPNLVLIWK